MILKAIWISIFISVLIILFYIHKNYTKPVYNKIHNVWEEDPDNTEFANGILLIMLIIAFIIGLIV